MDFYQIATKKQKDGATIIYPKFMIMPSKDIMIRGKDFYAIWNEQTGLWSTNELDVYHMIDSELFEYKNCIQTDDKMLIVHKLSDIDTGVVQKYKYFTKNSPDNYHPLDNHLIFSNTVTKKTDYASKRLPYPLEEGSINAYEELMSILYIPEEREKLEWAIGSIITGDSKFLQKFIVLYGEPGSGKGTFLNILQKLFDGYFTTFEAKSLAGNNNVFCTEVFKDNPLVAIQHDGDLSKVEDNSKLNSIISHELMSMNEKYKSSYTSKINAFLFMGTNKAVQIPEAKSGLIRRLIDVHPSGKKIKPSRYDKLIRDIDFELGAIAYHCRNVYLNTGKTYYNGYEPKIMLRKTNLIYNFVIDNFDIFKEQEGVSGMNAFAMFKQYCDESNIDYKISYQKFREELDNYFEDCKDGVRIDGKQIRSYFSGFKTYKFTKIDPIKENKEEIKLTLNCEKSLIDEMLKDCPAQYATEDEKPYKKWSEVTTKLSDINTKKIHYIRPGENHIVIDFDLTDEQGNKSAELNLEAASKLPPTYTEFSKGGSGVHLHYIYDGDVTKLSRVYSDGIEIKVFTGNSSLRRRLTKCNNIPVATINSGLPLKGENKKVMNQESVKSEKKLRELIDRCLRKEIHPGTKSNVDFIFKILEDAYKDGLNYDVTNMRPKILAFANNSTNQADTCIKLVNKMKFKSEEISSTSDDIYKEDGLIFYDVEVFKNLFVVVWKKEGENNKCIKMINPTAKDIEPLFKFKLVGFNCRRYDNHILYARYIGYDNMQLYDLSQKIIDGSHNCFFGEAYNISYADVYDFSNVKQSLKKWEIELGLHHQEYGRPWNEPVPEDEWDLVADYCCNDVIATEATFNARKSDYVARQILADISGLSINDTTQMHTAKIIFGNDKNPQLKFIYTDLSEMFPGYKYDHGVSTYRDEITSEGGYVYSEPGMYSDVVILDVTSMHPNSLINMNMFGPYTKNFENIVNARIFINEEKYEEALPMFDGKLKKYLTNKEDAEDLGYALKIVINMVYGFTSAKFDNKFKDPRNKDNIVAKRGALFMIDLKHAVQEMGYQVIHIKTDSIKVPNADDKIINFITDFGKRYGYNFKKEAICDRLCLVNDAVYIARYSWHSKPKKTGKWDATGTQFAVPYVFKTLFSHEPIEFKDLCETKTVQAGVMYLDMNENLGEDQHDYCFIGRVGLFCPILPGFGGGSLYRMKNDKYYAVTGTKGYRWLEAEVVSKFEKQNDIDKSYYINLVDAAVKDISAFGDFEWFISEPKDPSLLIQSMNKYINNVKPQCPCGKNDCANCTDCQCKNKKIYKEEKIS